MESVTPKNIMKHIVEMQKYFRNHQPHSYLINKNGIMQQIPNTRWNFQKECVRTFVENFHKYNEILMEQSINSGINNILSNKDLYVKAKNLYVETKPIDNCWKFFGFITNWYHINRKSCRNLNLIISSELSNYRDDITTIDFKRQWSRFISSPT